MSLGDKISNKAEDLGGKAKEAAGNATGDEQLQDEGRTDKAKAGVKDAIDNVKDSIGDAAGNVRDVFRK